MKALALLASPRAGGSIGHMLDAACAVAEEAGYEVERIHLYGIPLKPCTGCMACRRDGVCVIGDGLSRIRDALLRCDRVILAAPTYFANVPGPLKTLFDRLSGAVMTEDARGLPHGRLSKRQAYFLLTACTTPAPFDRLCGQSSGALRAMDEFFRTAGMRRLGAVVFPGSKGKNGKVPRRVLQKIERRFKRGEGRG